MRTLFPLLSIAALMLSGCTGGLDDDPRPAPPADPPVPVTVPVQESGAAWAYTCVLATCIYDGDKRGVQREVAANETLVGFRLALTGDVEASVRWVFLCDGQPCGLPTAEGPLPLALDVSDVALRGPFSLVAQFAKTDQEPGDPGVELSMTGEMDLLRHPDQASRVLKTLQGEADGVGTPCVVTVECENMFVTDLAPIQDRVERVNTTFTWDATTPATERLTITINCDGPGNCGDAEPLSATGTSPLVIEGRPKGWAPPPRSDPMTLTVHITDPSGAPVRQPFHVAWTLEISSRPTSA